MEVVRSKVLCRGNGGFMFCGETKMRMIAYGITLFYEAALNNVNMRCREDFLALSL